MGMLTKFFSDYKKQLIFFTVCFFVLKPILEYVSGLIVLLPNEWAKNFLNTVVIGAAKLSYRYSYIDTFTLFIVLFMVFTVWIVIDINKDRKKKLDVIEIISEEDKKTQEEYRWRITKLRILWIAIILWFFLDVYHAITLYVQREHISRFQQNMAAIGPYIDDQQEEKLQSDWAMMKEYEDYKLIKFEMKVIAHTNKIVLPASMP
jgi:hypothetical protein